ncbi:MAG: hypothetical protein ACR2IL_02320 [Chitinophagaceae bacterium]
MTIYTSKDDTIMQLDGVDVDGWRIEIVEDGAGVPYVNEETIQNPIFSEFKRIFDKLTPIEYTPHEDN